MNAERLHALAKAISRDLSKAGVASEFENLVQQLKELSSSPGDASRQTRLSNQRKSLNERLSNAESNNWPPIWRQSVVELGISDLLGEPLRLRIEEIIDRNQMTPAVAVQELTLLQQEVAALQQAVTNLNAAFDKLHIGEEVLNPGQCEVGVLIPRQFVKNRLDQLGREFKELDDIFEPFAELATGTREGFPIKAIASSDFGLFLDALPQVAACIADGIQRILTLYKQYLEIRKIRNDLLNQKVPDAATSQLTEYLDGVIASEIPKIADEMVLEYRQSDDEGRTNELKIAMKHSLHKIAIRIDRGFNISITANPPPESDAGEANDPAKVAERQAYERIQAAQESLKFIKTEGEPLLKLPPVDDAA